MAFDICLTVLHSVFPMMVWVDHIFKKLCVSVGMCLCMFVYRHMYMCACEQLCVCVCAFLCPCALGQRSQEDIGHSSLLLFALSLWNSNAPVFLGWGEDSEPAVPISLRNGVTSSYTDTKILHWFILHWFVLFLRQSLTHCVALTGLELFL